MKNFEFRDDDIAEFGGIEGVVKIARPNSDFPIFLYVNNVIIASFTKDGRFDSSHTKPLLKLVRRPKQKVTRTLKQKLYYSPELDLIILHKHEVMSGDYREVVFTAEVEVEV